MATASATHERIRTAALELFLAEGINGLSMRRLGAHVGVTATAIYRHYPDKKAIVADLVSQGFELFIGYMVKSLRGKNAAERFHLMGKSYIEFATQQGTYYKLLFSTDWAYEVSANGPLVVDTAPDVFDDHGTFNFLTDRIRDLQVEGYLLQVPIELMAIGVWGLSHGLTSLFIAGNLGPGMPLEVFENIFMSNIYMLVGKHATPKWDIATSFTNLNSMQNLAPNWHTVEAQRA
jgi:AcrR family transcriptional regulator